MKFAPQHLELSSKHRRESRRPIKCVFPTGALLVRTRAYVIVWQPNTSVSEEANKRGYIAAELCAEHYGYIMKRVLLAEGDVIGITYEGVRVNGQLLSFSAPLEADRAARSMPYR